MKILYLMTARGGSKGVARKNLQQIAGVSLIGWKATAAKEAMKYWKAYDDYKSRLVISTEDDEIATEAKFWGVEVPFKRPDELATDEASSDSVVKHALDTLGYDSWDAVMLLEPSSPFATSMHLCKATGLLMDRDAELVCGMRRTEPHSLFVEDEHDDGSIVPIICRMDLRAKQNTEGYHSTPGYIFRRQALPPQWTMNGAVYLFRTSMFQREGKIYGICKALGLLMDQWHGLEIDTERDLELARYAVEKGYVVPPESALRSAFRSAFGV